MCAKQEVCPVSEQEPAQTIAQPRPVPEGYKTWNEYWTKEHNQPWRTEPEIDEQRQTLLAERRAVKPEIDKRIYPFRNEHGSIRLSRADVEWLLATHESNGVIGPVLWNDPTHEGRVGIDMRGAIFNLDEDLSGLPLAGTQGGLSRADVMELVTPNKIRSTSVRTLWEIGGDLAFRLLVPFAFVTAIYFGVRLQAVPKQQRDELPCLHEQDSSD